MRATPHLINAGLLAGLLLAACTPRMSNDDDSALSDDDDSALSDDDDSTLSDDDDSTLSDDDDSALSDDDDSTLSDDDDSANESSLNLCDPVPDSDPFELLSAAIVGDSLQLIVEYGGGCETHEFGLCWNGLIAESAPPQISLDLIHDANNDSCLALISESLEFDISLARKNLSGGEVIIHVGGESLSYTF
jgi:hypothetical protein